MEGIQKDTHSLSELKEGQYSYEGHACQEMLKSIAAIPTGKWSSMNINITEGPGEGPQININYSLDLPKDLAIKVQSIGLRTVADVNEKMSGISGQ